MSESQLEKLFIRTMVSTVSTSQDVKTFGFTVQLHGYTFMSTILVNSTRNMNCNYGTINFY